jgi:hypothetical protein
MAGIARSAWVTLVSGLLAILGAIAFGFTDAGFFGLATSLGDSLTALVASVIWARNAATQHVLRAAVSVGIVCVRFSAQHKHTRPERDSYVSYTARHLGLSTFVLHFLCSQIPYLKGDFLKNPELAVVPVLFN